MTNTSEKAAVAAVIDDWSKAIGDKDAARVLSHLSGDVVQYTLAPPLQYKGKDAEDLQGWFATWKGPIGGEARDVEINAGSDVAFARSLVHMTGTKTDGEQVDLWFRQTLGLISKAAHGVSPMSTLPSLSIWMVASRARSI